MVFGIIFAVGYIIMWRPTFRYILDDIGIADDPGLLLMVILLASLFNVFWPAIMGYQAIVWVLAGGNRDPAVIARKIAGESREQKIERLQIERQERERYIAKLEKEVGIVD